MPSKPGYGGHCPLYLPIKNIFNRLLAKMQISKKETTDKHR
jgi:hypothetical protein